MRYYGIFENGILTNASQLPIYTDNSETREISQEEYDLFIIREEERQNKKLKLRELNDWFENYFEKQLIQSMWQTDFVISFDKYFEKEYNTVEELKEQGEKVRAEIKLLRGELNG